MIIEESQRVREKFKQDMFKYVDITMKSIRKEARNEKGKLGRDETRFFIWSAFDERFTIVYGIEYTDDENEFTQFKNFYEEYIMLKKLNLKKK